MQKKKFVDEKYNHRRMLNFISGTATYAGGGIKGIIRSDRGKISGRLRAIVSIRIDFL